GRRGAHGDRCEGQVRSRKSYVHHGRFGSDGAVFVVVDSGEWLVSRKQEQRFGEYTSTCISTGIAMTEKETTNSVSIEPRSTASVEANEALRETPTVGKTDSKDSKTKRKRKRRRKRVRIGD